MDLSKARREPAPEPPKLRVARLPSPPAASYVEVTPTNDLPPASLDLPDLPVFEGGESLEEGEDIPSVEEIEREEDSNLIDDLVRFAGHQAPSDEEREELLKGWADERRQEPLQTLDVPSPGSSGGTRHLCFVEPCGWYLDVPPIETPSIASLMGAGPGLAAVEQAHEVEQLLTEHLSTHSVLEWARALKKAQDERDAARSSPGVITSGYVPPADGIIPGPAQRDPEREAAIRAVDARLGRTVRASGEGLSVEERNAADQRLREARARQREARKVTPYDLTPRWSQDLEPGVVGIKR